MNTYETLRYTILDLERRQFQFSLQPSGISKEIHNILKDTLKQLHKLEDKYERE